jgi:hypothetical protein
MRPFSLVRPTPRRRSGHSIANVSALKKLQPRQLAFDVALALAVLVLGLMSRVDIAGVNDVFVRQPDWLHTVLTVLMAVPLVLRRVYPTTVFGVVLGAWVIDRTLDYPEIVASVGVLIAFYTIGTELSRRRSFLIGGLTALFLLFGAGSLPPRVGDHGLDRHDDDRHSDAAADRQGDACPPRACRGAATEGRRRGA